LIPDSILKDSSFKPLIRLWKKCTIKKPSERPTSLEILSELLELEKSFCIYMHDLFYKSVGDNQNFGMIGFVTIATQSPTSPKLTEEYTS